MSDFKLRFQMLMGWGMARSENLLPLLKAERGRKPCFDEGTFHVWFYSALSNACVNCDVKGWKSAVACWTS